MSGLLVGVAVGLSLLSILLLLVGLVLGALCHRYWAHRTLRRSGEKAVKALQQADLQESGIVKISPEESEAAVYADIETRDEDDNRPHSSEDIDLMENSAYALQPVPTTATDTSTEASNLGEIRYNSQDPAEMEIKTRSNVAYRQVEAERHENVTEYLYTSVDDQVSGGDTCSGGQRGLRYPC